MREQGWDGLLIASTQQDLTLTLTDTASNLHAHVVTPDNVVSIFNGHHVPLEPDYVSIEMDSVDVWVARSLLSSKYR
jgi:hypothetical protein